MKLICYLSLGSPSLNFSKQIAKEYVKAGCDVIEVDFPAKDPYLDSPYIQGRMKEALKNCSNYQAYMDAIESIQNDNPSADFIVLIYEKTILDIGIDQFIKFCKAHQLEDIICVGNEHPNVRNSLMDQGLKVSTFVRYQLPQEDIVVAKKANGFIYLQAKPGEKLHPKYQTLDSIIPYLKSIGINTPIYCGVGISTPEDIAMVKKAGADGAFVGSAILKLHNQPEQMKATIKALKART